MNEDQIEVDGLLYRIGNEIGEGGEGSVFVAERNGQKYAIKIISKYNNPIIRQMVDQEIKTQQMFVKNQHIIRILGSQ